MKSHLLIIFILIIYGCSSQQSEQKSVSTENQKAPDERESIHQQEWERHQAEGEEFSVVSFIANEQFSKITEQSIGNFRDPKYSTDDEYLFFTTHDYSEIWMHDFKKEKNLKLIELPGCGKGFQISQNNIYFRTRGKKGKRVVADYSFYKYLVSLDKLEPIYNSDKRLSTPVVLSNLLYFLEDEQPYYLDLTTYQKGNGFRIPYYYVENGFLIKVTDKSDTISHTEKSLKFVNCKYSRDGGFIYSLTTQNGVAVYDIEGNFVKFFEDAIEMDKLAGSNLVVYTTGKDDGQKITQSNIFIGFLNSNKTLKLKNEFGELRFNPSWALSQNKIAYANDKGQIKTVSFNIEKNKDYD